MPANLPDETLAGRCADWLLKRIRARVYRPGMRVPSVRAFARQRGVSVFTAVEAYGRLVAGGHLEPRRGSGFFVRARATPARPAAERRSRIDPGWLNHHMLEGASLPGPGLGTLPKDWLDGAAIAEALRALGRQNAASWLASGSARGFEPLRALLQQRLARIDIVAEADQIVLTTGITHALDLVLRARVPAGASVLVLDPSWFGAYGVLAAHGARVVGVPCTGSGPDLAALERIARVERPRLLVIGAGAMNPLGIPLTAAAAARIVEIARRFDFDVFEDDAYADLSTPGIPRLGAVDGLERVFHAGSFSKTLAPNLRVGFVAGRADLARTLAEDKILTGFATPELNERVLHRLLTDAAYDRRARVLRERLARCRARTRRALADASIDVFGDPRDGLFAWIDMRTDTNRLAAQWRDRGLLLAPGSLFSPQRAPSRWMRFNVTTPIEGATAALLGSVARRTQGRRTR